MSARRPGTCGMPGPADAHCSEHRLHDYSCYDSGEDFAWNEDQWYDFDLEPHACDDPDCTDQGYRGPEGRESEYGVHVWVDVDSMHGVPVTGWRSCARCDLLVPPTHPAPADLLATACEGRKQ